MYTFMEVYQKTGRATTALSVNGASIAKTVNGALDVVDVLLALNVQEL